MFGWPSGERHGRYIDKNLSTKLRANLEVLIGKLEKDKRSLEKECVGTIALLPHTCWSIVQIGRAKVERTSLDGSSQMHGRSATLSRTRLRLTRVDRSIVSCSWRAGHPPAPALAEAGKGQDCSDCSNSSGELR